MNSIHPHRVNPGALAGQGDDNPRNALVQAAAVGDLQALQRLRGEHNDLNLDAPDDWGRTALVAAVSHGHLSMVEQLVQSGAHVDILVEGLGVLHRAALNGHLAMVQTLLAFGADINQGSESRETPLMLAIQTGNLGIARFLLQQEGIQVNATSHIGETALLKAVSAWNPELARELVSAGAQVDLREGRADSAFVRAFRLKDKAMMKTLLDLGADINQAVSPYNDNTVLMEAVIGRHLNKARWLIAHGADLQRENANGWTALRLAAIDPKGEEMLRLLLEHGVEPEGAALVLECSVRHGARLLPVLLTSIDFRALSEDHQMRVLTSVVRRRESEAYELLLGHGADPGVFLRRVNALDPQAEEAQTIFLDALHMAAWCGDVRILEALSRQGFDLLTPLNHLGENALHGAVERGHLAMVDFLLSGDRAAQWLNARNHLGLACLHFARPGQLEMARLLLQHGADVNQGGTYRLTPLIWCMKRNDEPLAELLLDHGALCSPDAINQRNPLHWAVAEGRSLELVKRLSRKVDIDAGDCNQHTALMLAVKANRLELVQYLLDEGAQIDLRDDAGNTALHLAGGSEQKRIAQLLIARGADETLRNHEGVAADRAGGRTAIGSPPSERLLGRPRPRGSAEAELAQLMRVRELGADAVGVDWRHEDLGELPPGLRDLGLREGDWLNITDSAGIAAQYRVVLREDGEQPLQQRDDPPSRSLMLQRQG